MSENTKKVYQAIRNLAGSEETILSLDDIRRESHVSRQVAYIAVCILNELGYISYVTTGNKPGRFKILKEL